MNLTTNSNVKLILGNYFSNYFQLEKEQFFLKIGGEELEKTIDDFNNELNLEKKETVKYNIFIYLFIYYE